LLSWLGRPCNRPAHTSSPTVWCVPQEISPLEYRANQSDLDYANTICAGKSGGFAISLWFQARSLPSEASQFLYSHMGAMPSGSMAPAAAAFDPAVLQQPVSDRQLLQPSGQESTASSPGSKAVGKPQPHARWSSIPSLLVSHQHIQGTATGDSRQLAAAANSSSASGSLPPNQVHVSFWVVWMPNASIVNKHTHRLFLIK
jgi:hypothetical protein